MASSQARRVVVTGLGMVTPLADGVSETWSRILASESGIRRIENFDVSDLPAKIAGQPFRIADLVSAIQKTLEGGE